MKYEDALSHVLLNGKPRMDRTGTGTWSVFGVELEYDLRHQFPLIESKEVNWKAAFAETLWFLTGSTNVKDLKAIHPTKIWDAWADADGELGPVYGKQWRDFNGVDQIAQLMDGLRNDPLGRRHLVSAWDASKVEDMALPPCHYSFQVYYEQGFGKKDAVHLIVNQRSADMFLGVPFNLAGYGLLLSLIANELEVDAGRLIWRGGDCHIYFNHEAQVKMQLARTAGRDPNAALPELTIRLRSSSSPHPPRNLPNYRLDELAITNYHPAPAIPGIVSV